MNVSFLVFTFLSVVTSCVAYKSGAPDSVCVSLLPHHFGTRPQEGSSPYDVSAENVGPNKIKVTISSPHGEKFRGFILQARSANDRDKFIAGVFENDDQTRGITCHGHEKSALTHVNPELKTHVTTEWTGTTDEDIIFRATVVHSFNIYWAEIDSAPLKIEGKKPTDEEITGSSVYHGCFEWKGCFGIPSMCVNDSNCVVLFTYEGNDDGSVTFGLHGLLKVSEYMAMGLSNDNKMGEDSVTGCLRVGSDDVEVQKSWNEASKQNTRKKDLPEIYNSSIADELTTCYWKEPKILKVNDRSYDFAHDNIYILLALGPLKESGELSFHRATLATQEPVKFFEHGWIDHTVYGGDSTDQPPVVTGGKQLEKKDKVDKNCCSHLNFSLLWFAFFVLFYAGGRNALSLV